MRRHILVITRDGAYEDVRSFPTFDLADTFWDGMAYAWTLNHGPDRFGYRVYVFAKGGKA